MRPRVFIVAGVRLYREGVTRALERSDLIEIVGTAGELSECREQIADAQPDVVLLDVPADKSARAVGYLLNLVPTVRVVALAVSEADHDIVAFAEAGVSGYVTRESSLDELEDAVLRVTRGEAICSPYITATLLRRVSTLAAEHRFGVRTEPRLTSREVEVVRLIERGLSNKEIARQLWIELPTVKNHVHHILEKLQVRDRVEAAAWAETWLADVGY